MGPVCLRIDDSINRKEVKWGIVWTSATLVHGLSTSKQEHIALIVEKQNGKLQCYCGNKIFKCKFFVCQIYPLLKGK